MQNMRVIVNANGSQGAVAYLSLCNVKGLRVATPLDWIQVYYRLTPQPLRETSLNFSLQYHT